MDLNDTCYSSSKKNCSNSHTVHKAGILSAGIPSQTPCLAGILEQRSCRALHRPHGADCRFILSTRSQVLQFFLGTARTSIGVRGVTVAVGVGVGVRIVAGAGVGVRVRAGVSLLPRHGSGFLLLTLRLQPSAICRFTV